MSKAENGTAGDDFDIEAWISAATPVHFRVSFFLDGAAFSEHAQAVADLDAAKLMDDKRLGGDPRIPVAQRIKDLEARMNASKRWMTFRKLEPHEVQTVNDKAEKDAKGNVVESDAEVHWLALACVEPANVTYESMKRLADRIGWAQVSTMWDSVFKWGQVKVTVPFSLAASGALSRQDS